MASSAAWMNEIKQERRAERERERERETITRWKTRLTDVLLSRRMQPSYVLRHVPRQALSFGHYVLELQITGKLARARDAFT